MALNALDGMMATTYHQKSILGEILNETGDIFSDFLIFFPLLKLEKENIYLVAVFLFMSIANEFCGILGKAISGIRRYEGPMGKSDRAFVIGLYGVLTFFSINIGNYFSFGISIIILLLVISTANRIIKILN
jgi:CDP-diacylglycerol---glycerol-3-phosphate 3-phosphatidyltransferase